MQIQWLNFADSVIYKLICVVNEHLLTI